MQSNFKYRIQMHPFPASHTRERRQQGLPANSSVIMWTCDYLIALIPVVTASIPLQPNTLTQVSKMFWNYTINFSFNILPSFDIL